MRNALNCETPDAGKNGFAHRLVRWLTPPANREEFLGDLAERDLPTGRYVREALRALPFLVFSRIRRTTNPVGALVIGAFMWFAMFWGPQQPHPLAGLIPTLVVLAAFALCDAYRSPAAFSRWARACLVDIVLVGLAVLACQGVLALLAPQMLLKPMTLMVGVPVGLGILCLIRMQFPSGFHQPPSALRARELTAGALRAEIDAFEGVVRRAIRIELTACLIVAACLAALLWAPAALFGRVGNALTLAGLLFVAWFLWRHGRVRPVPPEAGFEEMKTAYSAELVRRTRLSRTYFWWYLLPIFAGPVTGIILTVPTRPGGARAALVGVAVFAITSVVLVVVQLGFTRRGRQRVEQLALVREKPSGETA